MKRFSLPQRTHDRFMRTGGTSAHRAAAHHSPSSDCAVKSVALNTSQALKARLVLPRWNRCSRETFASHVFLPKCWGWHQIKRKSSGKKRGGWPWASHCTERLRSIVCFPIWCIVSLSHSIIRWLSQIIQHRFCRIAEPRWWRWCWTFVFSVSPLKKNARSYNCSSQRM